MSIKILFVTGLYPRESEAMLKEMSGNRLQNAANVFQWSIVEGLMDNDYDFEVVSFPFLPSFPMKFSKLYTPSAPIVHNGKSIGTMESYSALAGCKNISIRRRLKSFIVRWIEENQSKYSKLIILTYTPHYAYVCAASEAVKQCKCNNVVISSIVTDLVDDMLSFASNRGVLKRLQCKLHRSKTVKAYKHINRFILLTQAMEEKIKEAQGKNIVVESLVNPNTFVVERNKVNSETIFLYTGALDEFTCVKELIEAFRLTTSPEYKLTICGVGALESYVKSVSEVDKRIDFLGVVSRGECLNLQRSATCLINPRKPNGAITKYSFPSKTVEYMSSGTPMIGYRLEGIPEEYYEHMYIPEDLSNESLARTMEYVANLDSKILSEKAKAAHEFLIKNKTSQKQVRKMVEFIIQSK